MQLELTTDIDTSMECLSYFWIHIDEEVLFPSKLFVSIRDLILDPGIERFPNDRVHNVNEPLAWNLVHVPVIRKIVIDPRILLGRLENTLNAEVLILWHIHHFDVIAFDATGGLVA